MTVTIIIASKYSIILLFSRSLFTVDGQLNIINYNI